MGQRLAGLLIVLALAALYLIDLEHTPVAVGSEEAQFANIGASLASSGRTLEGDSLPLMVRLGDPDARSDAPPWGTTWYEPMLFYLVALTLKLLPFSAASIRVPVAIVGGVVNPLLMYVVGRRLFPDRRLALLAALLVALAPAHVMMSRQAVAYLLPLPFVLGWLWAIVTYSQTGRLHLAFVSGFLLGVSIYTYVASWIVAPVLLAFSILIFRERQDALRASTLAIVGFAIPVSIALIWLVAHPNVIRDLIALYRLGGGDIALPNPGESFLMRSVRFAGLYADYFNPGYLFVTGGARATTSTARAGILLLPAAICIPAGVIALTTRRDGLAFKVILLGGFLLAPLPAVLGGEPRMVQRELLVIPFAALICAYGVDWLNTSSALTMRAGAFVLLALAPAQFGIFARDYWTHYKLRSSFHFDSGAVSNVAGRLITLDRQQSLPAIFVSTKIDGAPEKLRFHLTKAGRLDLLKRARMFGEEATDFGAVPIGGVQVIPAARAVIDPLVASGHWQLVEIVMDVDQQEAAAILKRTS